jgi:hypothetical protein
VTAPYTYPEGPLDPDTLLGLIGTFWTASYNASDQARAVLRSRLELEEANRQALSELLASESRFTAPVYAIEPWLTVTLRQSEMVLTPGVYDGTYAFDAGLLFDGPAAAPLPSYPAPAGLASAPLLCNRLTDPSLVWVEGVDYVVTGGRFVFRTDPFSSPLIAIAADGDDHVAGLWGFRARRDEAHVYRLFGSAALLTQAPSSPAYRDLVNSVFDAAVTGTTITSLQNFLAAATGVPYARGNETVQDVFVDARGLCVVTDANAYRFNAAATSLVSPGSSVRAGDPLVDSVLIDEFNAGAVPAGLAALATGRGVLAEGYFADLVFQDKDVPLTVTYDSAGRAKVSFPLGGSPDDVARFFDDTHALGVANGVTLAHLLDVRTNPVGEPGPASLPATVNPLRFLCSNVLRANAVLVRLKPPGVDPAAPGLRFLGALRGLVPPQTLLVVLVELAASDAPITMDGPGGTTAPGGTERLQPFAAGSFTEHATTASVRERVKLVSGGRCLGDGV